MAGDKNSSLKARDRALVKLGIAALIAAGGYVLGTQVLSPKVDVLDKSNGELSVKVSELKNAAARTNEIKKQLVKMEEDKKYILGKFPSDFTIEKAIETISNDIIEKFGNSIGEISYIDNGDFFTFVGEDGVEDSSLGKISSATVSVSFGTNYPVLKEIIKYLNEELPTKVSIHSLDVKTSDKLAGIGGLEGEATFIVYYGATITPYTPPVFNVDISKDNLFE